MKYKDIYPHWAMDQAQEGEIIYVLDRETCVVHTINRMVVSEALNIINDAKRNSNRYVFWTEDNQVEETEESENVEEL